MKSVRISFIALGAVAAFIACHSSSPSTAPGAGTVTKPAAPPATATPVATTQPPPPTTPPPARGGPPGGPPQGGQGGPPGGFAPGGRGPQIAPDSNDKLRQIPLKFVADQIVGRENEPAEVVFKNIQVLKGMTASNLLKTMDAYGKALNVTCTSCHMGTDWANESRPNKGRARIMQTMLTAINTEHLSKMNPGNPGRATCMTCHHGLTRPNQSLDANAQRLNEAAAAAKSGGG